MLKMIQDQAKNIEIRDSEITMKEVKIGNEIFYKISNVDSMRPFFMTIVSDSNHWLFVASNGGISCGRKNSEYSLFPYYTDDKITESAEHTGCKTIFQIVAEGKQHLWEPFSIRNEGRYNCQRNLYKNQFGNKIIFEEINQDLGISFLYEWNASNQFGFVRKASLINHSEKQVSLKLVDGFQNVLPFGTGADLQNSVSNLADAYKRSELLPESGLGIFALSAIIVDKAEPSEALKANLVWSSGLENPLYLLSSAQLQPFRKGGSLNQEEDVKGEKGAYLISSEFNLASGQEKNWWIVANVNQTQSAAIELSDKIKHNPQLLNEVLADVEAGTQNLVALAASADGLQFSSDDKSNTRHFSNVLFNIMRGGIFDENYQIGKSDFSQYLKKANSNVFNRNKNLFQTLPDQFSVFTLKELASKSNDTDLIRLATEYLPLKFSRRHGDPSRPWNKFTINTRSEIDGSKILDYEGNWRDIFQNWESLANSYPEFIEGMIFKFLNASTFDGYNPYRVTKGGFDWETIEPDNPWSYIGYWGDHQIIYLLKFLEFLEKHKPGKLQNLLNTNGFVYANVPYRIKSYAEILKNPKDTIEFDHKSDLSIREKISKIGADGALLTSSEGSTHYVEFCEKMLATVLAKLSNFVPDGGIWMNTQRPEWNDANNALVGNGLSMVTLGYLRRFLWFFDPILKSNPALEMNVSEELLTFFQTVANTFEQQKSALSGSINDSVRKQITDALGMAGSNYRSQIYTKGFSGKKKSLSASQILNCFKVATDFLEHAIKVNKRADDLYHTYNLISYDDQSMQVAHLSEMLEGQVAVLSSGFLTAEESLKVLDALKASSLYRPDQNSYILYPNKNLAKFLQKNTMKQQVAERSSLLKQLLETGNNAIVEKDIQGNVHFNGNFRNAQDVKVGLEKLDTSYKSLVAKEKELVLEIFEDIFRHKEFTGRSGTFYGYEGLGSIYWHMVSKLLLAVQETCIRAVGNAENEVVNRLFAHYHAINDGIGVHKSPQVYGAFPTDPYSHTPFGKGAQQPGMTGQVKEDILCRFGELGVLVTEGKLVFDPLLLKRSHFSLKGKSIDYVNLKGEKKDFNLEDNALLFTYCQVPVVYVLSKNEGLELTKINGKISKSDSTQMSANDSKMVFHRTGEINLIKVFLKESRFRN